MDHKGTIRSLTPEGRQRLRDGRVAVVWDETLGPILLAELVNGGVGQIFLFGDASQPRLRNVLTADPRGTRIVVEPMEDDSLRRYADQLDVIVDCAQQLEQRRRVNRQAMELDIPLVEGSAAFFGGFVTAIRRDCACLECLLPPGVSQEPPSPPVTAAAGVIGSLQACECMKILLGIGKPLYGKLLRFDGLTNRFHIHDVHISGSCDAHRSYQESKRKERATMNGYAGKLLFVDLTTETITVEDLTEEMALHCVGGYGIGVKVLFDRMPAGVDPLAPESMIGFCTGTYNATAAVMGGRYTVVSKSPANGWFNDANSGGYFGPELKRAGFDAVFVSGKATHPVYLWIKNGQAEIRDASKFWGMDCKHIWKAFQEELGDPKVRVAAIGPGGENLSRFAAIINCGHRAAGRGGTGAVMGSKLLKAVVVRGTGVIPVGDPAKLSACNKKAGEVVKQASEDAENFMSKYTAEFMRYGTSIENFGSAMSGDTPVRNWGGSGPDDFGQENAKNLDIKVFDDEYKTKKYGCAQCVLRCGAEYSVKDSKYDLEETERPEYESFGVFGANCLNHDREAIIWCNELCNRAGLDTITAGSVIAWVMECYEHGILTKEELDGIEAKWGDADAMVALMEKMASGEGVGKTLLLGQKGAADAFGKGHEYLVVAGGIEPPMHDSRLAHGYTRMYKYDPTPGRHVKGGPKGRMDQTPEQKNADQHPVGADFRKLNDIGKVAYQEMMNATGICMFSNFVAYPGWLSDVMSAVLGREYTQGDFFDSGIRLYMMRWLFNYREGIVRKDYWMSDRMQGVPALEKGPLAGVTVDTEKIADDFFARMGCDPATGKPYKETLEKLGGMEDFIRALY